MLSRLPTEVVDWITAIDRENLDLKKCSECCIVLTIHFTNYV